MKLSKYYYNTSIQKTYIFVLLTAPMFLNALEPEEDEMFEENSDPGLPSDDPGAPISDYWWVLALIGIYFIYKKYQVLQKQ